jgi:alkylhydroperoxidase family enzyme
MIMTMFRGKNSQRGLEEEKQIVFDDLEKQAFLKIAGTGTDHENKMTQDQKKRKTKKNRVVASMFLVFTCLLVSVLLWLNSGEAIISSSACTIIQMATNYLSRHAVALRVKEACCCDPVVVDDDTWRHAIRNATEDRDLEVLAKYIANQPSDGTVRLQSLLAISIQENSTLAVHALHSKTNFTVNRGTWGDAIAASADRELLEMLASHIEPTASQGCLDASIK